ncbi:peroxiredoxin [Pontiella sulfatireligans]|uniref:thioredoxin-dependent peroxiredoxin n=1 Tax=Pontiella sulfatireligans TaxID=2750658 RepID=A0A6C2UDI5_9BACT|nr:peroxiredoxin [Pontiella sulfatireligans]VGO18220.1 Putative peroxiredoxin bcp [Pontiella sulfatireligans]
MQSLKFLLCTLALFLGLNAQANEVQIVNAKATKTSDTWTIAVTLNHADVDRQHFADSWRIVTKDGKVLGLRELGHPHKDQPFTRDLKNVQLPDSTTTVYIEAHDKVHGWSKERFELKLAEGLQVGEKAPSFQAMDQDGKPWRLQDHTGGRYLVLYFYPAAMTGGCTKQACSYRDYVKSDADSNIEIVGISGDTPQSLKYFQQAEQLNFTLLSDPDGAIAKMFGVPVRTGEKSIKRTVESQEVELSRSATASRWTFIIDPQGKVVYRDTEVKATDDRSTVVEFIRNLEKN